MAAADLVAATIHFARDSSAGFGSIRGCDFDAFAGVVVRNVGSVDIVGNEFTIGVPQAVSLSLEHGLASVTGNKFLLSVPVRSIVVEDGAINVVANNFDSGRVDATLLAQTGQASQIIFSENIIVKDGDIDYRKPVIDLQAGAMTAMGNVFSELREGRQGKISNDNVKRFIGNVSVGWPKWEPIEALGRYGFN